MSSSPLSLLQCAGRVNNAYRIFNRAYRITTKLSNPAGRIHRFSKSSFPSHFGSTSSQSSGSLERSWAWTTSTVVSPCRNYSSNSKLTDALSVTPATETEAKESKSASPTSPPEPLGKIPKAAKMFLSFTCKVCNGSNSYLISKRAYNHGVVIVTCQSCSSHHLIADHMHWFPQSGGARTIEEMMEEKGDRMIKIVDGNVKEIVPKEE